MATEPEPNGPDGDSRRGLRNTRCIYPLLSSSIEPSLHPQDLHNLDLYSVSDELQDFEAHVPRLREHFYIVDKLGQGTFSSVWKAIDLRNSAYDNEDWIEHYARSMLPGALPPSMAHAMDTDQTPTPGDDQPPVEPRPRYMRASEYFAHTRTPVYVAIKRIFVTSSPHRIYNELAILQQLRGFSGVSHLITAWRIQDQVIAVMPYVRHIDFQDFYRIIPLGDLRYYFHSLLSALRWCHAQNIMHRDVKPGNFLYNPVTGTGTLCDFGLAEIFDPTAWRGHCHHGPPTPEHPHGQARINDETYSTHFFPGAVLHPNTRQSAPGDMIGDLPAQTYQHLRANVAVAWGGMVKPGFLLDDPRPTARASRAGTRGFRAPEVLLKCPDQTVAIDIWSVGVIMLCFLTKRFPLFNAMDDAESLLELGTIFGKRRMEQVALLHSTFLHMSRAPQKLTQILCLLDRTFICSIPTVEESPTSRVPTWIHLLNPHLVDTSDVPDSAEHLRLVSNAVDLARNCLQLDCTRRRTADNLLKSHPFLEDIAM